MAVTLIQIQNIITAEYARLVAHLGLSALPLDVYEVDDSGAGGATGCGTDKRNATPGYTPTLVVLPQEPGDLANWTSTVPQFPPTSWDCHTDEWPMWRTELWHEVVHQYQHQIVSVWDPQDEDDGHANGWPQAVADVASRFGVGPGQLFAVL